MTKKSQAEKVVKDIRRATRNTYRGGEDPDRAGWPSRRGQHCRTVPSEGIAQSLYYSWSKEFLEAGKKRLAVIRRAQANQAEVKDLRARLWPEGSGGRASLENRLLKKNMSGAGGDRRMRYPAS